ncbi:Calponin-homology (CH) domain-containing protein [Plasmodiophora brassicae]|uniref:Uncharacterized protein n=1 Tax=Plasmodiophora brassicae TaxID=37360 RepID=A0A3P3YG72_PLABS|nr:unnamed protein product [Plasmodiophora brassicae]
MQIPPGPLFDWITSHGVALSQTDGHDDALLSGGILAQILAIPKTPAAGPPDTWARIATELEPFGIIVDDQCRSAIIQQGNVGVVFNILAELFNRSMTSDELLSVLHASLHPSLGIDRAYAQRLLADDNNIQLREYLRDGRDGVLQWLATIADQQLDDVVRAIGAQPTNLICALRVLSPGLVCQADANIAQQAARLLMLVAVRVIPTSVSMREAAWRWVQADGLTIVIDAWRRHPQLSATMMPMLECLACEHIHDVVRYELPKRCTSHAERLGFVHEMLTACTSNRNASYFTESLLDYVARDAKTIASSSTTSSDDVQGALGLLALIATQFAFELGQIDTDYAASILDVLRQHCRTSSDRDVQVTGAACLCTILAAAVDRDPTHRQTFTGRVYKSVIFVLMDRYGDTFVRQFIMANLATIVDRNVDCPVATLIEPLTKQMAVNPIVSTDLDLCIVLCKHAQLSVRSALPLLHVLAKASLDAQNATCARLATIPFCVIVSRFADQDPIRLYVQKFVTLALRTFIDCCKPLEDSDTGATVNEQGAALSLEVVAKITHLPQPLLRSLTHPIVIAAIGQYRQVYGYGHPGLESIDDFIANQSEFGLDEIENVLIDDDTRQMNLASAPVPPPAAVDSAVIAEPAAAEPSRPSKPQPAPAKSKRNAKPQTTTKAAERSQPPARPERRPAKSMPKSKPAASHSQPIRQEPKRLTETKVRQQQEAERQAEVERKEAMRKKMAAEARQRAEARMAERLKTMAERQRATEINRAERRRKQEGKGGRKSSAATAPESDSDDDSLTDEIEGMRQLLDDNDQDLREAFRKYKGIRPVTGKFTTFDHLVKADSCMSISDFHKFWEDVNVCPLMVSKATVASVFRACASASLSVHLIDYREFSRSIWQIARHWEDGRDVLAKTGTIVDMIHETVRGSTPAEEAPRKRAKRSAKKSRAKKQKAPSRPDAQEITSAVVDAMATILAQCTGADADRSALARMLEPESVSSRPALKHDQKAAKEKSERQADEEAREARRKKRRQELAKQLEMQRQEAAIREANRKQEEEALRKKAEEDRIAKRKAEEEAKRQARKKVELYRKKKQEEEEQRKTLEAAKKQVEAEERRKSNALFIKQKREREELQLKAQQALEQLRLENAAKEKDASAAVQPKSGSKPRPAKTPTPSKTANETTTAPGNPEDATAASEPSQEPATIGTGEDPPLLTPAPAPTPTPQ